jgi:hydrogenase maturation protease
VSVWDELERPGPESVTVGGVEVRRGTRVRLLPRTNTDVFDLALAGRVAIVDALETDMEDRVHLVVTVEDDPGRDVAESGALGHRFFFSPDEVEPLPSRRVLVAGIGNVFLGDDGWGVTLAERLADRPMPDGVDVVDYGIRGMDLAYALGDGWETVVLLDATPRGEAPGTLYVIEADTDGDEVGIDAHGMDPVKVIALARALGRPLPRLFVVGVEPLTRMSAEDEEVVAELSAPVRASLDEGVRLVESLLADLLSTEEVKPS